MHTEQPLTSVEAFALALVEASSRLTGSTGMSSASDAGTFPVADDDDTVAAAE